MTLWVILIASVLYLTCGPWLQQRAIELYWQEECLNHPIAPGSMVYSSGPPAISIVSPAWSKFDAIIAPIGIRSNGTIYLGERKSHNGLRRLIGVDVVAEQSSFLPRSDMSVMVAARVIEEGSVISAPREASTRTDGYGYMYRLRTPLPAPASSTNSQPDLVVCAGADDPADQSHFTFSYDLLSERVIYDCWLLDDGNVRLDRTSMPRPPATQPPPPGR
jgi:hypothetical protein